MWCPVPKLANGGNRRCQCADCDEFFNSLGAFDKHRTGDHATGRFCMTAEQMEAAGMAKNSDGFWVSALLGDGSFAWGGRPADEEDLIGDSDDYEDLI